MGRVVVSMDRVGRRKRAIDRRGFGSADGRDKTHTTICLRPSRGLRMNLRVRRVTGASESAMVAVLR